MPPSEAKCDENWNDMLERLTSYKEKHGDCLVPTKYKEDTKLGRWVSTQRKSYKNKKLSNDRVEKLKSIGFVFNGKQELDDTWNDVFERLISYKQKYGNCLVPIRYQEDTKLGNWVNTQRQSYKNKKLSNDRIEKLKSIDFVFCQERDDTWNDVFERLISYKQKYGNCLVPIRYQEDAKLGNWVNTQRQSYKNKKLSNDRIEKLKSIGFVFCRKQELDDARNNTWNDMCDRLISYKEKYGKVPNRYQEDDNDTKLGRWVEKQRDNYKNDKLSNERVDKLKSIGFVFHQGKGNSRKSKLRKIARNASHNSSDDDIVSDILVSSTSSTNSSSISSKETVTETPTVRPIISKRARQQKVVNENDNVYGDDEFDTVTGTAKMQQQTELLEDEEMMDENNYLHNEVDEAKANECNTLVSDPKSALPAATIMAETNAKTATTTKYPNIVDGKTKEKEEEEIIVADKNFCDESGGASPISSIITGNNTSSVSSDGDSSSLFADAEEDEEEIVVPASSSVTTSNSNSCHLSSVPSNKKTTSYDGNDSIFADAEEDDDISWGLFQ